MQSPHPRKAALIVEYDGTSYRGFQYQSGVPTVQSEIESAIHRLTLEKARVKAAGRTDVGVHAKGQAVAFLHPFQSIPGQVAQRPESLSSQRYRREESLLCRRIL